MWQNTTFKRPILRIALGSGKNDTKTRESLTGKLQVALGISRAAGDADSARNDYHVRQPRKIVEPQPNIAIEISGAI
ncbi:electron transfer flavoprotein subunit beta [Burkholderia lata]|uniref:Electron transfer flavoprotein subunit beta n=1 Tax=Burkholderia lata (strain ATCC 17760 / DSM 23089 / LMG 22485 / NCIMB 9086 / R18194 / 383) TaxID=482957 RepID=A0A6P2SAV3_BURL3|nr:electron transfer flavoprotein subunit beta [Burkholderia lata]